MNKSDFIDFIAQLNSVKRSEAESSLNMVLDSIEHALEKQHSVNIMGFGTFNVAQRQERQGHHPKTGEKITIEAYNQPVFKAGKRLKDKCNS